MHAFGKIVPVIVDKLFPFFDVTERNNPNLSPNHIRLTIRVTGVINVASNIAAIHRDLFIKLKKVIWIDVIRLGRRQALACVLNNTLSFFKETSSFDAFGMNFGPMKD